MLETIVGGLVVAGVSAITYIAYRHPDEYFVLSMAICGILLNVAFAGLGWNTGVMASKAVADDYVSPGNLEAARHSLDGLLINFWLVLGGFLFATYASMLIRLGPFLRGKR